MIYDIMRDCPILWEKKGDSYVINTVFSTLGKAGHNKLYVDGKLVEQADSATFTQFFVRDISDDGLLSFVMANLYSSSTVVKNTLAKKRKVKTRKKQTTTEVQFSLSMARATCMATMLMLQEWLNHSYSPTTTSSFM